MEVRPYSASLCSVVCCSVATSSWVPGAGGGHTAAIFVLAGGGDAPVLASDPLLHVACVVSAEKPMASEAHLYIKNVSHASVRNVALQL